MKFSEYAWQNIEDIFSEIINHPFNLELAKGNLPLEVFKEYIRQDRLYLQSYSKSVAMLGSRATSPEDSAYWLKSAYEGLEAEKAMHDIYYKKWDIQNTSEANTACEIYSNFILAATAYLPYEVAVAAIMPCFWVYEQIGLSIVKQSNIDNPYIEWIQTYSSKEYSDSVREGINLMNKLAEQSNDETKKAMLHYFRKGTIYELLFYQGLM